MIDREEEPVESLEVNMLIDLVSFNCVPNDLFVSLAMTNETVFHGNVLLSSTSESIVAANAFFSFCLLFELCIMRFVPARGKSVAVVIAILSTREQKKRRRRRAGTEGKTNHCRLLVHSYNSTHFFPSPWSP